jgi:CBS domain-containing protein
LVTSGSVATLGIGAVWVHNTRIRTNWRLKPMKVSDVMTRQVVAARPEMSLRDLALMLSEHRISGVPVLAPGGEVLGVISEADILAKERDGSTVEASPFAWLFGDREAEDRIRHKAATSVAQAMTSPAVTIDQERPLREAAALMLDRGINRLPVTAGGTLVGILTRADLVRAYIRRDDEARTAIREQVLRGTMWLDPDDLEVEVREGVARIGGIVDRRSTANILERLIGVVDGVDRVVNELTWEFDDSGRLPADEGEREPGAASIAARDHPRPLH